MSDTELKDDLENGFYIMWGDPLPYINHPEVTYRYHTPKSRGWHGTKTIFQADDYRVGAGLEFSHRDSRGILRALITAEKITYTQWKFEKYNLAWQKFRPISLANVQKELRDLEKTLGLNLGLEKLKTEKQNLKTPTPKTLHVAWADS